MERPSEVNKTGPELHPANNITAKAVVIRFIVVSQIGLDAFITQNPDWGTAEYKVCDKADVGIFADVAQRRCSITIVIVVQMAFRYHDAAAQAHTEQDCGGHQ